ncbi:MAG TPA: dienelactone hydrolase family protein [Acidimicrobiales bacterium]|nr:dienelactone hydrolase family protein [Acidimicrobiales bacterium]
MRRRRSAMLGGILLLAGACAGGSSGQPPPAAPAGARQALAVDEWTEAFVDPSRTTEAHGTVAGSDWRTLTTRIFAPAAGQPGRPYPLLVFAHGSGGLGTRYDRLLRTWAEAGYVVAAPAFPIARDDTAPGEWQNDLPKLPGDMTFVIDQVLRLNAEPGSPVQGAVNPAKVGVAGHSMGGMTVLGVAGNTCCHDRRIKAAVVLAGRETPFGSGQFWNRIITPILLVHGDADYSVVYGDGRRAYANAPPPRFLLTILGGDHGTPFSGDRAHPQAGVVTDVTLDFLGHFLDDDAGALARMVGRADTPGVAKLDLER